MKTKKIISLCCAAALSSGAFAGITANAAASDLYTFTDGSTTGWTIKDSGSVTTMIDQDTSDKYLRISGAGSGERVAKFSIPGTAALTDNYVIEFDSLIHGADGQGKYAQSTQIAFGKDMTADTRKVADNDTTGSVGKGFAVKYDTRRAYQDKGFVINDMSDVFPEEYEIAENWTAVEGYVDDLQNKWTRTQAVISGTTATITMIDADGTKLIDAEEYSCDATGINAIQVTCARGDGETQGDKANPGYVLLDNIHIYSGAAETLTTDGLRSGGVDSGDEEAPKEAAPEITVPEKVNVLVDTRFDDLDDVSLTLGTAAQPPVNVAGLSISIGYRSSGADVATGAKIASYNESDKTLMMMDGGYSTSQRGARVTTERVFDPAALDEGAAVTMNYAFMINPAFGKSGSLYLLSDTAVSNSAYKNIFAQFTTDTAATGNNVVAVEGGKWYTAMLKIEKSGAYELEIKNADGTTVGSKLTGTSTLTALPIMVTNVTKDTSSGHTVLIDNMAVYYTGNEVAPPATIPPMAEVTVPQGAEKIAEANFDEQDLSERVRVYPNTTAMSFIDGGFTVSAGVASASRAETYGEVKKYVYGANSELSSQLLEMYDSSYATQARGPKVEITNQVSAKTLGEGETYSLKFQVKLDKAAAAGDDENAKIYLVDTSGDAYLGGNKQYKYILATISTGDAAGDDADNRIARVPEGEFVVVEFTVDNAGTYQIKVNDKLAFEHSGTINYTNSDKITPDELPTIIINASDKVQNKTYARIDDIVAYKTAEAGAETYTKYVATYDEEGVLTGLTVTPGATPEAVTNTNTQKTFFWTNNMIPYAAPTTAE